MTNNMHENALKIPSKCLQKFIQRAFKNAHKMPWKMSMTETMAVLAFFLLLIYQSKLDHSIIADFFCCVLKRSNLPKNNQIKTKFINLVLLEKNEISCAIL